MRPIMARFAAIACVLAAGLAALAPSAFAAGANIGTVGQVPVLNRSIGSTNLPSFSNGAASGGAMTFGSGAGSAAAGGMTISNSDGVTIQANIDTSQNIQASHSISVNETVNGQPIGSSYASASFLNVMTQAQADAADVLAQHQAANQELENEVLAITQTWDAQQQQQSPPGY